MKIIIAVPTHKLGDDFQDRYETRAAQWKILLAENDLEAVTIKGRSAEGMCLRDDVMLAANEAGIDANRACLHQGKYCKHHWKAAPDVPNCPYQLQFSYQRGEKPNIIIMPTAMLFQGTNPLNNTVDLLIIDEGFVGNAMQGVVERPYVNLSAFNDQAIQEMKEAIANAYDRSLMRLEDKEAEDKHKIRRNLEGSTELSPRQVRDAYRTPKIFVSVQK